MIRRPPVPPAAASNTWDDDGGVRTDADGRTDGTKDSVQWPGMAAGQLHGAAAAAAIEACQKVLRR